MRRGVLLHICFFMLKVRNEVLTLIFTLHLLAETQHTPSALLSSICFRMRWNIISSWTVLSTWGWNEMLQPCRSLERHFSTHEMLTMWRALELLPRWVGEKNCQSAALLLITSYSHNPFRDQWGVLRQHEACRKKEKREKVRETGQKKEERNRERCQIQASSRLGYEFFCRGIRVDTLVQHLLLPLFLWAYSRTEGPF